MDARVFLTELWGDMPQSNGPYIQIWTLADRRSSYYASAAGVAVDGDTDTYTGVALSAARLGTNRRAKANEVAAIAGLWLDLDIKPGGCANRTQALSFANTHARPTITIDTGHGVHAWWLLEGGPWRFKNTNERDQAASLAWHWVNLHRASALERDIQIDSVGDLARLMRLPSTVNGKSDPTPVTVIEHQGPRYTLARLCATAGTPQLAPAPSNTAQVNLQGSTDAFEAKLDALLDNSPEFAAVWTGARTFPSPSEADMSVCSLAATAMTDPELARLIRERRATAGDPIAKAERASYLERTIRRARSSSSERNQLDQLARRAA